ncbi:metal-sulfur cluster assembly factor [Stomatohabitans albus]|uniref:metal-sulfur cluster assembly factor n=1 Tax=Stomatohabitans albus TaxID=3110766 RepID=UPI00300DA5D8
MSEGWPLETDPQELEGSADDLREQAQQVSPAFAGVETDADGVATVGACFEALKAVIDPEIGINIVDLGLVYDIVITDGFANVTMTLTSIGCPLSELLHQQVVLVLTQLPGIHGADVEFTFTPPWSTAMLSEEARLDLRAMGMNV